MGNAPFLTIRDSLAANWWNIFKVEKTETGEYLATSNGGVVFGMTNAEGEAFMAWVAEEGDNIARFLPTAQTEQPPPPPASSGNRFVDIVTGGST